MQPQEVILLAEDRHDDVMLVLRAFEKAGVMNPVQVVRDGEQAIEYLQGRGSYSDRDKYPLPALLLLDLKMPKVDGFDVLRWIRTQPGLSSLRVVVLTSSELIRDVNLAYTLGANSFLVKPMDFEHFVELSGFITDHWIGFSKAPTLSRSEQGGDEPMLPIRKVLLRHRETRMYYEGDRRWGRHLQLALDFKRIELAESAALAEKLNVAEVVLHYERPSCELKLPVTYPTVRRP